MDLKKIDHRYVITLPKIFGEELTKFLTTEKQHRELLVELRGDIYIPNDDQFFSHSYKKNDSHSFLYSPRGHYDQSVLERFKPAYIDIDLECDGEEIFSSLEEDQKLILSHHDYHCVPSLEKAEEIVQKMCSFSPWMIKFVAYIQDYSDLLRLETIRELLNKKYVQYSLFGMGPKAHLTRVLSPLQNCFTYTYLDAYPPSAEGQLPFSFYQYLQKREHPALYGIIGGEQIQRSLSPSLHNKAFQEKGRDAVYSCFPTDNFSGTMKILEQLGLHGLSVTAPFKNNAMEYADVCSSTVQTLGVANTLIRKNGKWHAENSDVDGVIEGYPQLQRAKNIAILGAGGVVPAVLMALEKINPEIEIDIYVRDLQKAKIQLQGWKCSLYPLSTLKKKIYDAVVCAITEDVLLPLPEPKNTKSIAIDLRYGDETKFLQQARKKGFRRLSGIFMLRAQAEKQQEWFQSQEKEYPECDRQDRQACKTQC
jgi:shikimate dehydrogenase